MGRKSLQAERQQEILGHFGQAILEVGMEGATTGNVARRMGIKTSLLMHYFPTKAAMVAALVQDLIRRYRERFQAALDDQTNPENRIHFIIDQLLSPVWEDSDQSGLFYACFPLIFREHEVRREYQALFGFFRDFLEEELSMAIREGIIPPQDCREAAELLITIVEGKGVYHRILNDPVWEATRKAHLKEVIWTILALHRGNISPYKD